MSKYGEKVSDLTKNYEPPIQNINDKKRRNSSGIGVLRFDELNTNGLINRNLFVLYLETNPEKILINMCPATHMKKVSQKFRSLIFGDKENTKNLS